MSYALFLDDIRDPDSVTWIPLPKVQWLVVRNYDEFVATIKLRGMPVHISFDHDLADIHYLTADESKYTEKTGLDCAKWLVNYCMDNSLQLPRFTVHSMNGVGAKNITNYLENYIKFTKR